MSIFAPRSFFFTACFFFFLVPFAVAGRAGIAPVWQPLIVRLAEDGISGEKVNAYFATLPPRITQSPMGRKMVELYKKQYFPKPPPKPTEYYKGVVTGENAAKCRRYLEQHAGAFARAEEQYGVPRTIAVSLLFVETRLGTVLADVPENAFYTLASMALSRKADDISAWLPKMRGYASRIDWIERTMQPKAEWAYREVRALVRYMLENSVEPSQMPSSIYGAVGLCQFMPSNISRYGADGNGDNRIDLFCVDDAVASLANYLARHGWKRESSRSEQHALLMKYNHAAVYANTILALSDLVAHLQTRDRGR